MKTKLLVNQVSLQKETLLHLDQAQLKKKKKRMEEENKQNKQQQNSVYSHTEETRSHKTDKNNFGVHLRTRNKKKKKEKKKKKRKQQQLRCAFIKK